MTSRSRFVLSLLYTVFVLYLASGPLMRRALGDTGYTQLSIFHEVVSMIRDSYVDPVNMDRTLAAAESVTDIHAKARGYGIPSEAADGNDVVAVELAARRALTEIRAGAGPRFIEYRTYPGGSNMTTAP